MKKKKADKQITITGIVTAADWDEDDNIIAVTLSTSDEQEYLVSNKARGKNLLDLVQDEVAVTGTLSTDENGKQVITVKKYAVLEKEKDEWDEEWEEGS
jgi:hypothetical protein